MIGSKVNTGSKIFNFHFSNDDVFLTKADIVRAIGFAGKDMSDHFSETIDNFLEELNQRAELKGGFIISDDDILKTGNDHFYLNNVLFKSKNIITKRLNKSSNIALMVATIGDQLEILSKKLFKIGDYFEGYVVDLAASELVEKTADMLQQKLEQIVSKEGFNITNRYSPGYCGWDVSDQKKLFSFFPKDFCGIKLTESSLMIPIKSISGVIGIGKSVKKEDYDCKICDIDFCYKRERSKES